MKIPLPDRIHVFLGSTEEDQHYLARLQKHLAPLEREGIITLWSYQHIKAGADRIMAIREAISLAQLVILLVSADFLASSDLHRDWPLLEDRAAKGAKIIPVFVRYCDIAGTPLAEFQAINRLDAPVSSMSDTEQEKIWQQVAVFIRAQNAYARVERPQASQILMSDREPVHTISGSMVMYKEDEDLSLTASAREELVKALMSAFPRLAELEMLVSFKLDANFEAIAGQQNLEQATFSVVNWARSTGNVRALVRGASERNSGNASLRAFVRRYM
jgi:Effector-associated domain 1/TIR domain